MHKFICIACLFFLGAIPSFSQREGDVWLLGGTHTNNPAYGVFQFDFSSGDLELIRLTDERSYIRETSSSICDAAGVPLIWTNGMEIRGRNNTRIEDTISYVPGNYDVWPYKPSYWLWYYYKDIKFTGGFPLHTSTAIVPDPGQNDEYYIIYHFAEQHDGFWHVPEWRQAKVRWHPDDTYELLYKDIRIGNKVEWYMAKCFVTRHANGRDWWMFTFQQGSNRYFSFLIDTKGIQLYRTDTTAHINLGGVGSGVVSPNGNYLVRPQSISGDTIDDSVAPLFSIDRCEGRLKYELSLDIGFTIFGGAAFSPSERYVYLDQTQDTIWQYDLWADDINASRTLVGVFDGFIQPGWFSTTFGPMMQTPDGRIYIVPTTGSSEFLHVIDRPDLPATECKLLQHHINLGVPQGRSSPNNPNFRLGPIDGSPCDTLGIDNLAASRWRWEVNDSIDPLTVRFTDLSFYEPETWHWDFDDQSTSDLPAPLHTFPDYGLYHVCQIVSNAFHTDSTCRWVELLPQTSKHDPAQTNVFVSPNPFQESLRLQLRGSGYTNGTITLSNLNGVVVFHEKRIPIPISLHLPELAPGMYICTITEESGRRSVMKVVRQ
jgi:hypothetical protein